MTIEVKGVVQEIIYRNEENGYVIASIDDRGTERTVVGYIPIINVGETMVFTGTITNHPIYGEQIQVISSKQVFPTTEEGIIKYLGSGLIKGIGPKLAERIVEKFGKDSIDIIQYRPELLTEVKGIGEKKAEEIAKSFEEQREIKEVMIFLQQFGLSTTYALKVYKKYQDKTIELVKENPYRLADDIHGIGFKLADSIAKRMGIDTRSPYRIRCGIKYVLTQYNLEGHVFMWKDELVKKTADILAIPENLVEENIHFLTIEGDLQQERFQDRVAVYPMAFFYAETGVCKKILQLLTGSYKKLNIDMEEEIKAIEREEGITLGENQKEAIKESMNNSVMVLTGGPGTGKTTVVNIMIKLFEKMDMQVALAAPTGRAAKRLSETTGKEAKTIHRLLEYSYSDDDFGMAFMKNEEDPLTYDVIIIDEVSMVDIILMYHLLRAILPGTRLILVGDVDQLPSVGPGNVLRDIIDSGIVKVVRLNEIFRQAQESMIVINAHRINRGEKPLLNVKDRDFFFMRRGNNQAILETIKDLCLTRLPKSYDYDPMADIQIITPMKNGILGTVNLNRELQGILNPRKAYKDEKLIGERLYRVGDKVMQVKNNYNIQWISKDGKEKGEGVFNGDIGYITNIDEDKKIITVFFDGEKFVDYDFSSLDEIEHAYAITIHKSQGSEFPAVIIPISWGPPMLLNRNLLYTAVTRAKELVVLVGMEKYLYLMVDNKRISDRNTGLARRLYSIKENLLILD